MTVSDEEFWVTMRRALMMVAHALEKRYNFSGLLILLGGQPE